MNENPDVTSDAENFPASNLISQWTVNTCSPDSEPLAPCQGPTNHAWPAQYVSFQREISSTEEKKIQMNEISLDCIKAEASIKASVLATFLQRWCLEEVLIGDHVSTLSLAPDEVLTIEVAKTHHILLEESRETASTVEEATEETTTDKESINIANTSASSSNWSISGTGSFSLAGIGASGSATQSGNIATSVATTINDIHETTLRSTLKVSTQTKIQIRGVTETTVLTRETRVLRNPFHDRVLALNLYEINKLFQVQTAQDALRPMITVHLHPLVFDKDFIAANLAFLQESLIDPELNASLPDIVRALRRVNVQTQTQLTAALDELVAYLFDDREGWNPYHHSDYRNDTPRNAFLTGGNRRDTAAAVFDAETVGEKGLQLYFILHALHTLRSNVPPTAFTENKEKLMSSLAASIDEFWDGMTETHRLWLLDMNQRTELFRRLPGFRFLYKGLIEQVQTPEDDSALISLVSSLVSHLECHKHYYTEQYLRFLWEKLGRTFVIRLANSVLEFLHTGQTPAEPDSCRPYRNLYRVEEVQRDGLCMLILLQPDAQNLPANIELTNDINNLITELKKVQSLPPIVNQVIVPADGIHIEPTAGECILEIPTDTEKAGCRAEFTLKGQIDSCKHDTKDNHNRDKGKNDDHKNGNGDNHDRDYYDDD